MEDQTQIKRPSSKGTLRVVHISDLHNRHKKVKIPECDLLICSGDISGIGQKSELEDFFKWFKRQYQATYRILVAGNHDITMDANKNKGEKPDFVKALLYDFKVDSNNIYLENESVNIMGINIWGSPYSAWFNGEWWGFNVRRGSDSFNMYSAIPLGADIVITHGPPFGKNDWCNDINGPVGCEDLRYHIKRVKPLLCLSGHIHESYGYTFDDNTYYFNGAICNLNYEPVNKPWLLEVDFDCREVKVLN